MSEAGKLYSSTLKLNTVNQLLCLTTVTSNSQRSEPIDASSTKTVYMKKKLALLDHALILRDLETFTCRCKGGYCLGVHDAAYVGQIRSHVAKLGSQSAVNLFS